jgi:hypothetical protein
MFGLRYAKGRKNRAAENYARPPSTICFSPYFPFQSVLVCFVSRGWDAPYVRASSDHRFIVGALRARETVCPCIRSRLFVFSQLPRRDLTGVADLRSLSSSLWWPVYLFGQAAGLGQTARVQRASSLSLPIPVAGFVFRARGRIVLNCAHRATTVSSWGLCEHTRRSCPLPSPN